MLGDTLGIFASPASGQQDWVPASVEDLVDHQIIGPDRVPSDLGLGLTLLELRGQAVQFDIRTDNQPEQLTASRANLGIGVV